MTMRDYAGIAYALRWHTHDTAGDSCAKCPIEMHGKYDETCFNRLLIDAADAIEELVAAVPKWISVEERLPGKDNMVFVYYEWTGQSGTVYKEVSLSTLGEIQHFGFKLIAWMPLPEPPKEVE